MAVKDSASARLSTAIAKKTFNKISGLQSRSEHLQIWIYILFIRNSDKWKMAYKIWGLTVVNINIMLFLDIRLWTQMHQVQQIYQYQSPQEQAAFIFRVGHAGNWYRYREGRTRNGALSEQTGNGGPGMFVYPST